MAVRQSEMPETPDDGLHDKAAGRMDAILALARQRLKEEQATDGRWLDRFDTGVMPDAQTAISLHLLGVADPEWTDPLLNRLEATQRRDGSWGVYPGDGGDLSTTVECYYALKLYGRWRAHSRRKWAAQGFILGRGGLRGCRNLTKVFLAVGGEIPWSWLPSPRLYSWLFVDGSPIHLRDFVTFTRLHIPPMVILSALEYVADGARGPILRELVPPSIAAKGAAGRRRPAFSEAYRRRLARGVEMMLREREQDGTAAGYHSSTFLLLFALRALGYRLESRDIQSMLAALRVNVDLEAQGYRGHQQTCNAHVWNTALALGTLRAAGEPADSPAYQKGIQYLLARQQGPAGDPGAQGSGAWGFSSNNTSHPDVDDTVSCLTALAPVRQNHWGAWRRGLRWLLSRQNRDGGWSAFEKDSRKWWLEWLPANDMRRTMSDPSTPDITGRVVEFLLRSAGLSRGDPPVRRGVAWLVRHQERDGSWYGRWGTTYLYGTWCAVKALVAAGMSCADPPLVRAKKWLLAVQRPDGSFGEACESDLRGRYVPAGQGMPSQTAWGLDALLYMLEAEADEGERRRVSAAARRAADWLVAQAREGQWEEEVPTGSAFPGALHIRYEIYPKVWPLAALAHYRAATSVGHVERG